MQDEELRRVATSLMAEASEAVGTVRGASHGSMDENFAATAVLWSAYLRYKFNIDKPLMGSDVAQLMVLLKMSRTMAGDSSYADHYIDQIGYSGIAGALAQGVKK